MKIRCLAALLIVFSACSFPLRADDAALNGVGELLVAGKLEEARTVLIQAREKYIRDSNEAGEAVALLMLGFTDAAREDAAAGRADLAESAAKFTKQGDHFGAWMAMWSLAELEKREGRFDAALTAHEKTMVLLQEAARPQSRFSLETLKVLGPIFGMATDVLTPLAANPEIVKMILLRFSEVISRDAYGEALVEAGRLDEAEQQLTEAEAQSKLFGDLFASSTAAHMGDLRRRQWRFEEARANYKKALEGVKALPSVPLRDAWVEVQILDKLADLEVLQGRTDDALAWNDRALKLVRASGNPKREASVLEDRGHLLMRGSRFDAAEATFRGAVRVAEKNSDDVRRASIYTNLGALHMLTGNYGRAAAALESAIKQYQTLHDPYSEAPVWMILSEVYLLLDAKDNATQSIERARALATDSGFKAASLLVDVISAARGLTTGKAPPPDLEAALRRWQQDPELQGLMFGTDVQRLFLQILGVTEGIPAADNHSSMPFTPVLPAMAHMLEGKVLLERGENTAARSVFLKALEKNPSGDLRSGYLALIGATYWKENNAAQALSYFQQATRALDAAADDLKVEEIMTSYLGSGRRFYYDILIDSLIQQGRIEEAFVQSERARTRTFLRLLGNHRLNPKQGADEGLVREAEALRTEIAAWEKKALAAPGADAEKAKADLREARKRYAALLVRLKASNPEYAAITTVEPLDVAAVRKEIPAGTTMISYYVSPNQAYAWVIERDTLQHVVLPVDAAGLDRIACWALKFSPPRNTRGATRKTDGCGGGSASAAFDALFAPLQGKIHNRRLILIPHGALHYVPFAALYNTARQRYLIDDYTLSYAPSASAIRFLGAKETAVEGRVLVLGNPATTLPVDRLPGAEREAIAIARTLATKPVLGADARESLLFALNERPDLVHIAAHGIYEPGNPLFSRVALAPGGNRDGNLEVHEILADLDFSGVNLVVLSACSTGAGEFTGGDEIVGLTRALLYAGAAGVISTLWDINDDASAILMEDFYERLRAGDSAAEALRHAQLAVKKIHEDPRYWAAFSITGDPQGRWNKAALPQ